MLQMDMEDEKCIKNITNQYLFINVLYSNSFISAHI